MRKRSKLQKSPTSYSIEERRLGKEGIKIEKGHLHTRTAVAHVDIPKLVTSRPRDHLLPGTSPGLQSLLVGAQSSAWAKGLC